MANKSLNLGVDLIPTSGSTYILGDSTYNWAQVATSKLLLPTSSGGSTLGGGGGLGCYE